MRYKKCKVCHLTWNISIKANLSKSYECPECEAKRVSIKVVKPKNYDGIVSKVLLKNKKKFEGRIKL